MTRFEIFRIRGLSGALAQPAVYIYFLILAVLVPIFTFASRQTTQGEVSHADMIIWLFSSLFFSVAVVFVWIFVVAAALGHDFNAATVIRYPSRQALWRTQAQKILLLCAMCALHLTIVTGVSGRVLFDIPVNFTSSFSSFRLATGTVMEENISIAFMLIVFFIMVFLPITAMCLIVVLSKWIAGSPVFGALIVITISAVDIAVGTDDWGLIFNHSRPSYTGWLNIPGMFLRLLIPLGWVAGLIVIGHIVSKRRDFLNVQQK